MPHAPRPRYPRPTTDAAGVATGPFSSSATPPPALNTLRVVRRRRDDHPPPVALAGHELRSAGTPLGREVAGAAAGRPRSAAAAAAGTACARVTAVTRGVMVLVGGIATVAPVWLDLLLLLLVVVGVVSVAQPGSVLRRPERQPAVVAHVARRGPHPKVVVLLRLLALVLLRARPQEPFAVRTLRPEEVGGGLMMLPMLLMVVVVLMALVVVVVVERRRRAGPRVLETAERCQARLVAHHAVHGRHPTAAPLSEVNLR